MENNENLVTKVTENTEQTAEETPKTYTQAELDAIVGKRLARQEAKFRKENDRKYGDLINTLETGTGKKGVDELNNAFTEFYESKGVKIAKRPEYSTKDIETLARAEANEIINGGFEDVVDEVDRLTEIGAENMTEREKAVFKVLAEHRYSTEQSRELAKIGVTEDIYNSQDFKEFQKMFAKDTPIAKVYETYAKTQPKKEIKTMGSMKTSESANNGIKDYYSPEEARQFSKKDFDENPALFAKVLECMPKWKR
jgi:hypothetical protein